MSFSVLGTGSAVPSLLKTNDDLAAIVDTSDEWIRSHTGIEQRYLCGEESLTDLAFQAAEAALADSGCRAAELDLILCATISSDYITPSLACVLMERLGACCPAFDLNAACTGFVYALDVAAGYFARRPEQRILIVACDGMSKLLDWTDRSTCVLFGDGAGAVVLGPGNDFLASKISAQPGSAALYARNITGSCPFREKQQEAAVIHMQGQEVFRFAVTAMSRIAEEVLAEAALRIEDIAYVVPHQANSRILEAAVRRWKLPPEKCLSNIREYGNTSAASIVILLDEASRNRRFQHGDLLVLTAFGAGLTTGACVLRWSKAAQ